MFAFHSDLYVQHLSLVADHLNNPRKAYDIIEQVRGRVLTDLLLGGTETAPAGRANEGAISRQRLRLYSARTTAEIQTIQNQISLLEQARWVTPDVSIVKSRSYQHIPLWRVQQAMNGNATILEYVLANPASYCLVIRAAGVRIVRLPPKQRIDSLVASYLKAVNERKQGEIESSQLYEALLAPVADATNDADLMIVRDGSLNQLPFDALRDKSGTYVARRVAVSYLPSAGSFFLLAEQARRSGSSRQILALGGIPYRQNAEHLRSVIASEGFAQTTLTDLPNSAEEALTAIGLTPDRDRTVLIGPTATESAFKKALTDSYRVIHLAVHSAVDDKQPERAALVLLADPQAGEDGLLQSPEIAQLRIRAALVVLSACDTSVGPVEGQEGVASLSRSFFLAGAQNVVSTLWSIDDNSSLALLKQFYGHVDSGEPPAMALASAKREMLAKYGDAARPFYWAAFIYEGVPTTAIKIHERKPNERSVVKPEAASGDHRRN